MLEKRELTMLYLIALAYWLLCVRLCVQLEAFLANGQGGASFSVGALGVFVRRDYVLTQGKHALAFRAQPRYGKEKQGDQRRSLSLARLVKSILMDALRGGRFERLTVHLRLGFGDACDTAVASGAAHALICAVLAAAGGLQVCDLRVTPDFDRACLCARMSGIFSCQPGDIMLAALKQARRKRKEGLKWTSIPLRA
ncbi:MAG: DUF2953 domain-containing protein [Clostridia bacterium]|nr:DUF2953 domain-containing protein [Clostridia bacterium]